MFKPFFNTKWLIVAVVFTAIVIFFTHIPQDVVPKQLQVNGLDKIEHVLSYGVITFLLVLSLKSFSLLSALIFFIAISTFSGVDELTQPFVNRTADPIDWLADIIGIVVVLFSFLYFTSSRRQILPDIDK
jgi:VanZ family protein